MPTAAKLFAAIFFAAVGYAAAETYAIQMLPPGLSRFWLAPAVAGIGLIQGWTVMGANARQGVAMASGTGLRTSVQIAFWAILAFGLYEMFYRSTRLQYDQPGEAVMAALNLFLEYGLSVLTATNCLIVLMVGGVIGGALTSLINRVWS